MKKAHWLGHEIGNIFHFAKKAGRKNHKDAADDAPSWAQKEYRENEGAREDTANKEADRLMKEKYDENWQNEGDSKQRAKRNGERSKIQKWLKRNEGMK